MKKTKHNLPRKQKSNFIGFSKIQTRYLNEVRFRQQREWSETLESVYDDLGIVEKILQAPHGTYILRQDYSGLDVISKPINKKETEEVELQVIPEKKDSKDN